MAEEDEAIKELEKAFFRICKIPRPAIVKKILTDVVFFAVEQIDKIDGKDSKNG